MDLVVIMDGTISLGYEHFNIQRDFVLSVLSKMKFGPQATQLGIIQFSDDRRTSVEMEIGRHGRQEDVLKNVSNIVYQQGLQTKTGLAMHLGYEQFFGGNSQSRRGVDKVILLITDGKPVDNNLLQNVVKDLNDKDVRIVSVAIGTSNHRIQRFRYIVRTIASGFNQGFKAEHRKLKSLVDDVAREVCTLKKIPAPPEKKDILFALDGSTQVDTYIFNKAKSLVAQICAQLDITPNLIHVAMLQYSDELNTRIEFDLDQYTKYYQINESLQNVFHSKGRRSDLEKALSIVDEKIFNGKNGDRISAEDYLLLFLNDAVRQSENIINKVKSLKEKGVHVIIVGLGRLQLDFYETLASHPSDVNYIDSVKLKHIVGDLTAITCRKVNCEEEKDETQKGKTTKSQQKIKNLNVYKKDG
ncbi:collagen alpha-1(XII) chain-like [Dendronephthya gigantea]|uniref:collagen alpha-1(XII) chain-like n=1 Tax=Dendronephthya gigantea TaxID=151771 RepID=UPI00106D43EE|nr:collagen alpha-1(XII) chain-like [Dendronephthya gigantea]